MLSRRGTLAILPLIFVVAACGSMHMNDSGMGMMSASDIAGIVATANEGEIAQGQAASSKATSADVRAFAQMMVTDHTAALASARDTFSRNNITAGDNDTTRTLRTTSDTTIRNLGTYSGAAFDRAYMQSQVDMHQWLLTNLDTVFIPSSRGDLRHLLETQRTAVAAHLDRARQILGAL